jgi:hypothetical protein
MSLHYLITRYKSQIFENYYNLLWTLVYGTFRFM